MQTLVELRVGGPPQKGLPELGLAFGLALPAEGRHAALLARAEQVTQRRPLAATFGHKQHLFKGSVFFFFPSRRLPPPTPSSLLCVCCSSLAGGASSVCRLLSRGSVKLRGFPSWVAIGISLCIATGNGTFLGAGSV